MTPSLTLTALRAHAGLLEGLVAETMASLERQGLVDITGHDEYGDPVYELTDKGRRVYDEGNRS